MPQWSVLAAALLATAIFGSAGASAQPAALQRSAPEALVARNGTFTVKLTLVRKSTGIAAGQLPACFALIYHWNGAAWDQDIGAVVTDSSGNTKICTITIPYYWPAVDNAQQLDVHVWIQFNVDNFPAVGKPIRKVSQMFKVPLPVNSATTTIEKTLHY
jgi:hypothetical protein